MQQLGVGRVGVGQQLPADELAAVCGRPGAGGWLGCCLALLPLAHQSPWLCSPCSFALVQVASAHKAHKMWGELAEKLGGGGGWTECYIAIYRYMKYER